MKKIFILIAVILTSINGFAQRHTATIAKPVNSINAAVHTPAAAKTTAIGDTTVLSNINPVDTLTIYGADSNGAGGYATGTNVWNDLAFAERYDFNGNDSSVLVLGVLAEFSGKVNPASGKSVTFDVWNQGSAQIVSANLSYNGFPGTLLDTLTMPITQLGIGTTVDTFKEYLFAAPAALTSSFFVGYNINYSYAALDGDTLGLVCSGNGDRIGVGYTATVEITDIGDTVNDTVLNVQNATFGSDNAWYDNYTQNDSLYNNLAIFPVVVIREPSGVKGVTRNNLTFFGNYPNPATDYTNIKFSLAGCMDVTIQVMDMNGRVISAIKQPGLAAGAHIVPVNTAAMPAGDYLYLIRTSAGDGVAGKMTVVR